MKQPDSSITVSLTLHLPDGESTSFEMGVIPVKVSLETSGTTTSAQLDIIPAFRGIGAVLREYADSIDAVSDVRAGDIIDEVRQ